MSAAEGSLMPSAQSGDTALPPCAQVHEVADSTCLSCMAAQQGVNCWEVAVSPCCKRSRDLCSACPIYVEICKAATVTCPVSIRLKDGRSLQGRIHVAEAERLSDRINGPEAFLTVTEVAWNDQEGPAQAPHADPDEAAPAVLFVAKSYVASIQPLTAADEQWAGRLKSQGQLWRPEGNGPGQTSA